jgi:regulator of protease activity HflC (stomatin/prohibitin superfamily)
MIGAGFLLIFILWSSIAITIDPGEKGVLFRRFGGGLVMDKSYDQGFHLIAPWNKMYVYDVKIQEAVSTMSVLSKNGLTIKTELSYRWRPQEGNIPKLHNEVGMSYHETIIIPEIRSATREVIGKYLPEELYSTKREAIQDEIFQRTAEAILDKEILLDAVLIREVELPQTLQMAIERKLEQEQAALEYEFKLERAEKEAERLKIEAQGKATAFDIVNASLTDRILREKGIEATLKLAESPNAKVVVIGSGEDGLPLILGNN